MTNGDFRHFDSKLRIAVDLDKLGFLVMTDLFREGEEYVKDLAELKKAEAPKKRASDGEGSKRKVKKGPTLRERDPW